MPKLRLCINCVNNLLKSKMLNVIVKKVDPKNDRCNLCDTIVRYQDDMMFEVYPLEYETLVELGWAEVCQRQVLKV